MLRSSISFFVVNRILFLKVFVIWAVIIAVANYSNPPFRKMLTSYLVNKSQVSFENTLNDELGRFKKVGDDFAYSPILQQKLKERDPYDLLKLLTEQKEKHSLRLLSVTDKDGFVITRADQTLPRNDNLFISTIFGRKVMGGEKVKGYYEGYLNPSALYMVTGRPVFDEKNAMVGSLFVGDELNTAYAKKIAKQNSLRGTQVAFYNKSKGIGGSSFEDVETLKTLQLYFNSGSDWIKNGKTDTVFSLGNDFYFLKNIVLSEDGGALLFVPLFAPYRILFFVVLLLTFVGFSIRAIKARIHKKERNVAFIYTVVTLITTISLLFSAVYLYKSITDKFISIKMTDRLIYNSTLHLSPEGGLFALADDQFISVVLNTGGEDINAIEARISYNPEELEIMTIDDSASICDYTIEKNIDNTQGKIVYACAIVHDIFEGTNLNVLRLLVHAKTTKRVSLSFDEGTSVRANDGLGTEVLRKAVNGSYLFIDSIESFFDKKENNLPILYSETHFNTERWYKRDKIDMVWSLKNEGIMRYSLSKEKPDSLLEKYSTTTEHFVSVKAPEDGLYYFNIAEEKDDTVIGEVASFSIRVDRTPPENVMLTQSDEHIRAGDVVRFMITAEDKASGIASGYYLKTSESIFYPVNGVVYVPFPEKGTYSITARVFDNANNYTDVTNVVEVK